MYVTSKFSFKLAGFLNIKECLCYVFSAYYIDFCFFQFINFLVYFFQLLFIFCPKIFSICIFSRESDSASDLRQWNNILAGFGYSKLKYFEDFGSNLKRRRRMLRSHFDIHNWHLDVNKNRIAVNTLISDCHFGIQLQLSKSYNPSQCQRRWNNLFGYIFQANYKHCKQLLDPVQNVRKNQEKNDC